MVRIAPPFAAQVQPKSGNCFFVHCRIPRAMNCRSVAPATDSDARIPARAMSAIQPTTFIISRFSPSDLLARKPLAPSPRALPEVAGGRPSLLRIWRVPALMILFRSTNLSGEAGLIRSEYGASLREFEPSLRRSRERALGCSRGCATLQAGPTTPRRCCVHMKEATARIKINKLLEAAGWRFFRRREAPANICLEPSVTIKISRPGRARRQLREDHQRASSTSSSSTPRASPSSFLRQRPRTRTRWSARSRPANMPSPRTAASSSSPTATCTTSGILNAATPTSSPRFRRPTR